MISKMSVDQFVNKLVQDAYSFKDLSRIHIVEEYCVREILLNDGDSVARHNAQQFLRYVNGWYNMIGALNAGAGYVPNRTIDKDKGRRRYDD